MSEEFYNVHVIADCYTGWTSYSYKCCSAGRFSNLQDTNNPEKLTKYQAENFCEQLQKFNSIYTYKVSIILDICKQDCCRGK